jgi:hypothetical protein
MDAGSKPPARTATVGHFPGQGSPFWENRCFTQAGGKPKAISAEPSIPKSPLKKGTGSERSIDFAADFALPRGACPLFQHVIEPARP